MLTNTMANIMVRIKKMLVLLLVAVMVLFFGHLYIGRSVEEKVIKLQAEQELESATSINPLPGPIHSMSLSNKTSKATVAVKGHTISSSRQARLSWDHLPRGIGRSPFLLNPEKHALEMARLRIRLELFGISALRGNYKNGSYSLMPLKGIQSKQILIVTSWRSGSTFLGDILNNIPGTFYHFEPLHSLTQNKVINISDQHQVNAALNLVTDLFHCNYSNQSPYLRWIRKSENQFLFQHNKRLWSSCRLLPKLCFESRFVSSVCKEHPVQLMKLVRLELNLTRNLLQENPYLKIIYLVRDPRGTYNSRKTLPWCNDSISCSDPSIMCSVMKNDLMDANELQQEFPNRLVLLRYEDLSLDPEGKVKELFMKLGLDMHAQITAFLKTHTHPRQHEDLGGPYSTKRNSKITPFLWRQKLTFEEIQRVQSFCQDVIEFLQYPLISNPGELKTNVTESTAN